MTMPRYEIEGTDKKGYRPYDGTTEIIKIFGFVMPEENTALSSSSYVRLDSVLKDTSYYPQDGLYDKNILAIYNPNKNSAALIFDDFEEYVFTPNSDGVIQTSLETVNTLLGSGTMKVEIGDVNGWTYIYNNQRDIPLANGYDGFIFRLKSGAVGDKALMNLFIDGQGFSQTHFMYDVEFYDKDMNFVSKAGYHYDWGAFELPQNFDGYVYLPFDGVRQDTGFDTSKKITSISFGFIGGWWKDTTTYIDDLGYYKKLVIGGGKGDINGDGNVDIIDLISLKKYFLGSCTIPEEMIFSADVDGNGEIGSADMILLKKNLMNSI